MAAENIDYAAEVDSTMEAASAEETEPAGQQPMDWHVEDQRVGGEAAGGGPEDEAYRELLAQKAALEAELQVIVDELRPLKVKLEALDKSIAEDEAELPILEAAMMAEVREFLALGPKCMNTRPGA